MSNVLEDIAFNVGDIQHRPPGVTARRPWGTGVLIGGRREGEMVTHCGYKHLYTHRKVL